jgi:hypothetical protein
VITATLVTAHEDLVFEESDPEKQRDTNCIPEKLEKHPDRDESVEPEHSKLCIRNGYQARQNCRTIIIYYGY